MFGRIHQWSHAVLDFCLLGVLKLLIQFQYLWLVCSCFSLVQLGVCMFLSNHPFLPGCLFYFCIMLLVVFYDHLCFCDIVFNVSIFISDFCWFGPFSFSLMSLAKALSILFAFSKSHLLVSLIFSVNFTVLFISALIFMISFLLLSLGFVYSSFSSCFRYKVRLFIRYFSCFLR